jgi:catechol 2,3-dioxygenase
LLAHRFRLEKYATAFFSFKSSELQKNKRDALRHVIDAGIQLDGASDHRVSEALYLRDPDENGVELCWDRPREQWPHLPDGRLQMFTRALDLESLLAET